MRGNRQVIPTKHVDLDVDLYVDLARQMETTISSMKVAVHRKSPRLL